MKAQINVKVAIFAMLMAAASAASAGRVTNQAVTIHDNVRLATGNMVDARDSADNNQRIGCLVDPWTWGLCFATNAEGVSRSCMFSSNDTMINEQARAITSTSKITFKWDGEGNCTTLSVQQSSDFRPGSTEFNASTANGGSILGN